GRDLCVEDNPFVLADELIQVCFLFKCDEGANAVSCEFARGFDNLLNYVGFLGPTCSKNGAAAYPLQSSSDIVLKNDDNDEDDALEESADQSHDCDELKFLGHNVEQRDN